MMEQADITRLLKKHGRPMKYKEIAEKLKSNIENVRQTVYRMRKYKELNYDFDQLTGEIIISLK